MPGSPPLSNRSAPPLHLILERSHWLERAVIAVHLLAIVAALANPLPGWSQALFAAVIIINGVATWRRLDRVRGLTLATDGDWEVVFRDGVRFARLASSTVVTPWIVILHLSTEGGALAIPICRDAVDPESFRRLRVYLRTAGHRANQDHAT